MVDDYSPDVETQKQLDALAHTESVSVIALKNIPDLSARSTGVRNAKFEFILMMDSDDRLSLDKQTLRRTYADRAIAVLTGNPEVAFVHSTTWMIDGASGPTDSAYP